MKEPYEYCEKCNGEGVDKDPYGLFDFSCFGACDMCGFYEQEHMIQDAENAANEAYHS